MAGRPGGTLARKLNLESGESKMGCDIHSYLEVKIDDRWEHYKDIEISRNYELFGLMVDEHTRSTGQKGIAPARGLPEDINPLTKIFLDNYSDHTHSYLFGNELVKIPPLLNGSINYDLFSFFQDNELRDLEKIRLVFGFDS